MRLTLQDNPESLKRYRHLRPARASGTRPLCTSYCPGTRHRCSREKGHRPPHVAFGLFRRVLAVWDSAAEAVGSTRAPATVRHTRPAQRRRKLTEALKGFLVTPFSSLEELAWAVFFLVFVGFAVGGFLLIYLG